MPHGVNTVRAPTAPAAPRPRVDRAAARERIVEAATELVRERSFAELTVGEIMDRAALERTIFYRHFENVGQMLLAAGREAIDQLYAAQVALAGERRDTSRASLREALALPVAVYRRHGPILRAVSEAVAGDQLIAADGAAIRRRFDDLVAGALREAGSSVADADETAHALNLLNESYLLDAFGREPRVAEEAATETLTAIWAPLLGAAPEGSD